MGGNLTSIHSGEENDFVKSLAYYSDNTWIGGSDARHEGNWEWTDGSTWDYEYWLSDQPDGGSQDSLAMDTSDSYGRWRDLPESDSKYILCRMY